MVTENAKEVLVVIYCFEDSVDLAGLLERAKQAFVQYAGAEQAEAYRGNVLLVGVNYNRKTKVHECVIEEDVIGTEIV